MTTDELSTDVHGASLGSKGGRVVIEILKVLALALLILACVLFASDQPLKFIYTEF